MAFGKRLPAATLMGRGGRGLYFCGLMTALLLAGCGGGGSGDKNPGPNLDNPTITGRVLDQYSASAPVQGATVTLKRGNGQVISSATTDSAGVFSFKINPTSENTFATITAPTGTSFYPTAYINSTAVNIQTGITVPPQALKGSYNVGDVIVATETGGPPPPPF